uniref:Eukaryotic translation initiation factor 3 subunit I n=1 Tax=Tetraselmis sp. GSL018 TaxID=582737 RepID=A0A061RNP7_9CHLO|mmetsp:Transcript_11145/g.26458  ORF Transcript_11145/g.26458 Transcript_11145/m.26458 type:complete len:326 (+) Transcript_11145:130-1107(+)
MRPYILQGHSRPLTHLKYNREGDLLVSCAKDVSPCLWDAETGERIGTYVGHTGAVNSCDISPDSTRLITVSGDQSIKLWEMETGKCLFTIQQNEPARSTAFSNGARMAVVGSDPFMTSESRLDVYTIAEDPSEQTDKCILSIPGFSAVRFTRCLWGHCNESIIATATDGYIRKYDTETGKLIHEDQVHAEQISDIRISQDLTHMITASQDKTAKLLDAQTLEVLKTYKTERPINSADISPIFDHVVLAGGQDASQVTTTSSKAGKFESMFFHKIYEEEFGIVRGHFGPVNTVAFRPDGRSFVTGGEDGFIRMQHFDQDYFTTRFF